VNVIARRICPALPILIAILVTSIPSRAQMSDRIAPADILIVHANIHETKVVFTIVGGKVVYEADTK
jgi:hypothetical protein